MKIILLIGAIFLVLWEGILFGQEVQKPYSYKFNKGVGECVFINTSFDKIWTTAVTVLMRDKAQIVSAEKQSSIMNAEYRPFASGHFDISLYFEQVGKDVKVVASASHPSYRRGDLLANIGFEKWTSEEEKKFFDKMLKLLYEEG